MSFFGDDPEHLTRWLFAHGVLPDPASTDPPAVLGGACFRAAPQPHDLLEAERRESRLAVERAGLVGLDAEDGRLVATLRRPGGTTERRASDAVVLCTGPGNALDTDPLVCDLVTAGLARPDAVGLGLAVDAESRLRDRQGGLHATFRAFGPVTRVSFGEMTGEPDIVKHVARIAPGMIEALRRRK